MRIVRVAPVLAGLAAMLALAGCATTRVPQTLLPVPMQESLLAALPAFSVQGRVGIRAGADGTSASLDWRQQDEETRVRLAGPFGAGALVVTWRPDLLRLAGGGDEVHENAAAEGLLRQELGFVPPFEAMRYWVLGLEAPGEPPQSRTPSDQGRVGELVQQGWRIRYDQWTKVAADGGGVQLPRRLTITRDDLRLIVFVQRWKL